MKEMGKHGRRCCSGFFIADQTGFAFSDSWRMRSDDWFNVMNSTAMLHANFMLLAVPKALALFAETSTSTVPPVDDDYST